MAPSPARKGTLSVEGFGASGPLRGSGFLRLGVFRVWGAIEGFRKIGFQNCWGGLGFARSRVVANEVPPPVFRGPTRPECRISDLTCNPSLKPKVALKPKPDHFEVHSCFALGRLVLHPPQPSA